MPRNELAFRGKSRFVIMDYTHCWGKEMMTSYMSNVGPAITQIVDGNNRALLNETWNITAF